MMEYRDKLNKIGITLTKSGKQTCPQCSTSRHNKTEKCLSITYADDGVLYNCHNCGWSGIVFYRDKYENTKTYKKPNPPKVVKELEPIYQYFLKRGISKETVQKYDISYNDKKEIVIPYYKNGELVNIKYRTNLANGKKTFRQESDTEKTLFGMDNVPPIATYGKSKCYDKLIWVEGEIDVLSFAEQDLFAVSVPQGANEKKLECIENCFEFIEKFNTHIIAVDNDIPGDTLKNNLLNRLGKTKCKIVNWKQYKDANEALCAGEKLQDFIDKAEDINPDGIIQFENCLDEILSFNYEQDNNYYHTGWQKLDDIIRLRTKHIMIVTGYPSRGKSTFVDNLLINLSKRYDIKHLIASFESTIPIHYNSLLEMYYQKNIYKLKEENLIINEDSLNFINEHFLRFDIDRLWNIDDIIERTDLTVRKFGIKTLVIDPYNRLDNKFQDGREDLYVGNILSKLIMLAKKLDILVIFVAHPKKPDGEKMPNMYSISGSSDWYNMADYGIVVHRERKDDGKLSNFPQIMVQKVKNHSLGITSGGLIELYYNSEKRILVEQ